MSKRPYKIGSTVSLRTDPEGLPRIITKYEVSKCGTTYCLSSGMNVSWHYAVELQPFEQKQEIGLRK